MPTDGIPRETAAQVQATIDRLQLNMDNDYVNERIEVVRAYSVGRVAFESVRSRYPFIAEQMRVQEFDERFKERFARLFHGMSGR